MLEGEEGEALNKGVRGGREPGREEQAVIYERPSSKQMMKGAFNEIAAAGAFLLLLSSVCVVYYF